MINFIIIIIMFSLMTKRLWDYLTEAMQKDGRQIVCSGKRK